MGKRSCANFYGSFMSPHSTLPLTQPYLESREAKACGLGSRTEVDGSSHQAQ